MGPFLVFPTEVGVFRSRRKNTPVNIGLAALSALPPDPLVTEAPCPDSSAFQSPPEPWQPSTTIMLQSSWPRSLGGSQNLRYFHLFFHLFIQHTFIDRKNVQGMGAGDSKISEANSLEGVDRQVNIDNGHVVQK